MAALRVKISENTDEEWCVADAAMLLDLKQINLTQTLLESGVNLVTTPQIVANLDEAYQQEVQERSVTGQIIIESATDTELDELLNEFSTSQPVTFSEGFLCRLAKRLHLPLLTNCECLKLHAERRGIRAKSIIWVTDRLVNSRLLKPEVAARKLLEIQQRNPWMSKTVTQKQIDHWQSMVEATQLVGLA